MHVHLESPQENSTVRPVAQHVPLAKPVPLARLALVDSTAATQILQTPASRAQKDSFSRKISIRRACPAQPGDSQGWRLRLRAVHADQTCLRRAQNRPNASFAQTGGKDLGPASQSVVLRACQVTTAQTVLLHVHLVPSAGPRRKQLGIANSVLLGSSKKNPGKPGAFPAPPEHLRQRKAA